MWYVDKEGLLNVHTQNLKNANENTYACIKGSVIFKGVITVENL